MSVAKSLVVLIAFLAVIPTRSAVAADATLYELSEEMTILNGHRLATASFQGTAKLGTPLCPALLAKALGQHVDSCTVTGFGSDDVDINPYSPGYGTGTVTGTFAVVINADNVVDAPEYVVMTGTFGGHMYLTNPADFRGKKQAHGPSTQRIMLKGWFNPENVLGLAATDAGLTTAKFSGVFRLPFSVVRGRKDRPGRDTDAFYLSDTDRLIKVRKDERALGYPTVRIEVTFER